MIDLDRSTIKFNFKPNSSRNPHSSFCQKASAVALWILVANCVPIRLLAPVVLGLKNKRSRSHNQQMPAPAAAVRDLHPRLEYAIGFGRGFTSSKTAWTKQGAIVGNLRALSAEFRKFDGLAMLFVCDGPIVARSARGVIFSIEPCSIRECRESNHSSSPTKTSRKTSIPNTIKAIPTKETTDLSRMVSAFR